MLPASFGRPPLYDDNTAMRAIVLLLIGVLIGSFGTVSVLNALSRGNTRPKAVMTLLGYHMQSARKALAATQCTAASTHIEALSVLSRDVSKVFPDMGDQDATFKRYAMKFHSAAESAVAATAGADCKQISASMGPVSDSCKACHRDFNP